MKFIIIVFAIVVTFTITLMGIEFGYNYQGNSLCEKDGGIYVKTYSGYICAELRRKK